MERGKLYKVIYSDGQRERKKDLVFNGKDGKLIEFYNPLKDKAEILNEDNIIRMEMMDNGKSRVR